jgi:hypothetical protein
MKLHDTRNGHPAGELGRFYRDALSCLQQAGFRFLICGGYALEFYTGIRRRTKDIDVFVLPSEVDGILQTLRQAGYRTEVTEPGWLSKIFSGQDFIDVIHNSGNGLCPVDESWFEHGVEADLLDLDVQIAPVEEIIWQKCFIMVRHRFDGADVTHLLHTRGEQLDWRRLVDRFGEHWPVLLAHLILFEYVYPDKKSVIPPEIFDELLRRQRAESGADANGCPRLCRGTLLSKFDFQAAVKEWDYQDPRDAEFQT